MARFFIDRPIFAWVIALFIIVLGATSITRLPVAQYPSVAPPTVVLSAAYPGASAQTLEDSVLSVIEREMNGAPGLAYMESVAQANGTGSITLSFEPGTNLDLAQVEVQNRLARATPRLPSVVNQQGVRVEKSQSNFLMFTMLSSSEPGADVTRIADYAARNVQPELQRLPGIGQVQLFGAERAMRIWLDPAKLQSYGLTPADVNAAIAAQNAQVSADAYPGEHFPATLSYIAPSIDALRGSVEIRLAVAQPPATLRHEMTVSIDIEAARRPDALSLPCDSVREAGGQAA